ncbi:MAG: DUF222 domain-containing protein [Pseudonocardiales bacterium]
MKAAADLGPRRGLTGEALPPVFAPVADAQAMGSISAAQARVITRCVDELPAAVQAEHDMSVQHTLVEHAQHILPRRDGSARIVGELTALCAEALRTVLDTLARPRPAEDGTKDPRTPGQRNHDGLHEGY